jgi:hypothetical protein
VGQGRCDGGTGDPFIAGQGSGRGWSRRVEPVQDGEFEEAEPFAGVDVHPPKASGHPTDGEAQIAGQLWWILSRHITKLA